MSLQAKIEAVIYASEEPVTLPQLIGLLGEEAQAEMDTLDARQGSLPLGDEVAQWADSEAPAGEASGDQDAVNAEVMDNPELEGDGAADGEEAESSAALREDTQESSASQEDDVGQKGEEPAEVGGDSARETPEQPALDEKKLARERERRLREYFRSLLDRLIAEYAGSDRGLEIREVAGGFRLATKPEYHDAVRGFVKSLKPPLKLSLQALETLAVIAYKQPVTAPEIGEIRGVDSGGVLGSLMARKLITTAGRKAVIGRPILYKTTKEFLVRFGLKDINELPSIEEFEKMAGELDRDVDGAVQEEIAMDEATAARTSEETVSDDKSPALDELNTAPAAADVAESSAEMVSPRSSGREGSEAESGAGPSSGVSQEAARAVESVQSMRDVHEAQADGVPDTPAEADTKAIDNHEPYTGSDETGA